MGKLILCNGKYAKNPYHFENGNISIYSIEELCYYLYNNIYGVSEELFGEELVLWLRDEIAMVQLADKLELLLKNGNSLKDIVVSILCSADYYEEKEVKELITVIDKIYGMPEIYRWKVKADYYIKYGNYVEASRVYHSILDSKEACGLTSQEYGDIVHNLAVVNLHIASFREAALLFQEAYKRNHREESLLQYLYALKLGKFEEEFFEEAKNYGLDEKMIQVVLDEISQKAKEAENTENYMRIREFSEMKSAGRVGEYYKNIEVLLEHWKQEYRKGIL